MIRTNPLVTVVIPTFRELDCLKLSLAEFLKERRCEVVVGLDGDNPSFRKALRDIPIAISWTARRQGACTATNLAAAQARGQYFFLSNDDMVPGPGWLDSMLRLAGPNTIVSGTCWEPGLVPAPPPHKVRDLGRGPASFRIDEFFEQSAREKPGAEPGINYPFLISKQQWDRVSGLDTRFEPGSASDPDLFIRLALLEPPPRMVRAKNAVFYHFASRSSIFAGGRLSLAWKLHRRHGRAMFCHKWGRMWEHRFGEVPEVGSWRGIVPLPEPAIRGRLWRKLWFGNAGKHEVAGRTASRSKAIRGERVAIFLWGGLGNAVMALPMINAARKALGDDKVSLVLPKAGLECLVRDHDRLEGIYTYRDIESFAVKSENALSSLPYPRWRYGLAAFSTGAKTRVGDTALPNPLLSMTVDTRGRGTHWVERDLALLEGLGIVSGEPKFEIPISDHALERIQRFLGESGLPKGRQLIGLHPGSGNPMRRWPEERFAGLGKALVERGKKIVVFGGPGERELAGRVSSGIGGGAAAFCGSLPEALALISLCRAFAAADSGLAHCAAALGVPTLAVMGPSGEETYRPFGPKVRVVSRKLDCRPCYHPGRPIHCVHRRRICLDIGVDEVLEGLRELA